MVEYIEKHIDKDDERKIVIKEIMISMDLFATESYLDESKTRSFIFDKLNDLLKSIDTSLQSTNYDLEIREIWKERLQNIFLNFSMEKLEQLHEDINEDIECAEALS